MAGNGVGWRSRLKFDYFSDNANHNAHIGAVQYEYVVSAGHNYVANGSPQARVSPSLAICDCRCRWLERP